MSNENTFTIENTFDDLFLDENKQEKTKKNKEIDYQDIKEFVHLNVHSDHSILLGYGTVKEYVDTAKELNMSAIALTDFNSVTGIYDFLNECNKNNILGIPGIVLNVKAETTNYYNLTLLAYNKKGLYNIIKLSSIAYNHYEETPMITLEELFLYNEGIIVLTGNSNGLIGKLNNKKSINELKNIISRIQAVFNENFYIELINDENIKIKSLLKISSLYEIKTVITNDVYMPKQEDWKAQESIMAIGNNDFITETSILSGGKRQVIDNGEHRKYLKTLKEMNDVFPIKKYKVCYENTLAIVDKCRKGNPQLEYNEHLRPMKELNGISANDYLKKLVQDGFKKIRKKQDKTTQQESIKRIKEELEVIISNDFVHYFLVVQDYIKFAKDNDIPVGPGRGCFLPGNIVYLKENRKKKIEDVIVGTKTKTHDTTLHNIEKLWEYDVNDELCVEIKLSNGETISATHDHKIFKKDFGFTPISQLNVGDTLLGLKTKDNNKENNYQTKTNIIGYFYSERFKKSIKYSSFCELKYLNMLETESNVKDFNKINDNSHFVVIYKNGFEKLVVLKDNFSKFNNNDEIKKYCNSKNLNFEEITEKEIDLISQLRHNEIKIISKRFFRYTGKVYDLKVEGVMNYTIGGVTVHNSAGGSEIAYLLGITEIDPIKYDLLFSRFLSSGRGNIYKIDFTDKTTEKIMLSEKINIIENGNIVNKYIYELKPNDKLEDGRIVESMKIDKVGSSPDIDTDFHTELREKVIQYCIDTYGKEKVANIITFGMFKPKNAIKSIMKINNVPFSTSNAITKLISQDDKTIEDSINNNKDFMDFVKMSKLENIIIDSKKMENRIRNLGVHACGVIISNDEINNSVPTTIRQDDGALITAWDYPTCESLGLLKADFLGLDTLDVIKLSLEYIKETEPEKAMTFEDLYNLPTDDKETFKLLQEGKTTSVFQFGSIGMKDLLRQMKPTCFDDISATTALYRPGPKEQGFHTKYAKRKNGEDKDTTPIHKSFIGTEVEKILTPTQNLLVYQEQIMQISMRCAGFSSMEADSLRKAIGKKKADLMASMKPRFVQGMLDNGYQKQAIEEMWKIFVSFGQYAFNKSHSVAYSIISYICAYLRTHFPVQYMAAMLQQKIKTDDFKEYLADVKNIPNVSLQSININESTNNIIPSKDLSKIILGLSSIKGINQTELEEIIKERETNGKFTNFENCLHRLHKINCLKKGLLELLAKSGAFDCFGVNRKSVADNAKEIIKCIEKDLEPKIMMTFDFGVKNNLFHEEIYKTVEDDYNYIEKCKIEFDLLGLYLTTNPLSKLEYQNQSLINKDFNFNDGKNTFIVVIPEFKKKITKNGISYNFKLVNEKNEINLNASKRAKFLLWLNDNKNNPEVRNFIKNNEISKELKNQLNKDSLWFSKKDILEELREIFIKKKESFCLPKLHTPYKIEISHNSYGTTILDWTEIYIDENGKRPLVFPVYSKEEIEKLKNIFKNPDITKNGKTPIIIRKINKMNIINDIPIKKFFINFENINTLYSMLAKQKLQNCDFLEKL